MSSWHRWCGLVAVIKLRFGVSSSDLSTLPVIMITITSACSRLISRKTSRPEPSGRSMSSKTTAGKSALKRWKASATEAASIGVKPSFVELRSASSE